ncbi:MAG: hypothetical protein R3344_04230 [Acidobacteriota bacterium]|nr:hypothetical protein [Acidobacteriota bacterium]
MKADIKLLEERIRQLIGRLRELRDERDQLGRELEEARQGLELLQSETPAGASLGGPETAVKIVEIKSALREAIQELRRD